jgi:chromate transporter
VLWASPVRPSSPSFALDVPFPAIVAGAALIGYVGGRLAPDAFSSGGGHGKARHASYGRR